MTDWIENYPGFPKGLSGQELGDLMLAQAEEFGAEVKPFTLITSVRPEGDSFVVTTEEDETYLARAVIFATGAVPKKLGVPGEAEYTGRGVSWCATCDGALYKDRTVCVVGGGDAAVEEALFLTRFAARVHLVHRRDELRATKCIQERCFANEKIHPAWNRVVSAIQGDGSRVTGVVLGSTTGEPDLLLPVDGVFIFVGVDPVNEVALGLVDTDEKGYIKIDHDGRTSWPGLYAAGDVTDSELKQVITAAAKGASAAFEAQRFVDEKVCAL